MWSLTIPLEDTRDTFFCRNFGLMTTHDDLRAGQYFVSWLIALRSHLARFHFEVLFDNKLYFENRAVNSLRRPCLCAINIHSAGIFMTWSQAWV